MSRKDPVYVAQPRGGSYYLVSCPVCGRELIIYAWRGAKRCSGCGEVIKL